MLFLLNLFSIVFYVSVQIWVLVLCFSIDFLHFLKCLLGYFLFYFSYTRPIEPVLWMQHVSLMKARWFHMPCLDFFSDILFGVLFFLSIDVEQAVRMLSML